MIISRAPLRISFFGGGTDYPEHFLRHGGAVLATAINKYSYVTVSRFNSEMFEYVARVQYSKVESVRHVDEIEHRVFRAALQYAGLQRDIEVHTVADLPSFTGLGSSSSFTVALLQALKAYRGEFVSPLNLAYEAIRVERDLVKDNVGCQDQTVAAIGGFHKIEFIAEDHILAQRVPIIQSRMDEFERHLVLVYTGITRRAAEMVAKQIKRVDDNVRALARMREMVDEGWDILTTHRSLNEFGLLLDEAWKAKRSLDTSISSGEIDEMYARGLNAGALGGKLLGAGGGGYVLFFVPPEKREALKQAFAGRPTLDFKIAAPGAQVIFAEN